MPSSQSTAAQPKVEEGKEIGTESASRGVTKNAVQGEKEKGVCKVNGTVEGEGKVKGNGKGAGEANGKEEVKDEESWEVESGHTSGEDSRV